MVDASAPAAMRRDLLDLLPETLLRDETSLRRRIDQALAMTDHGAREIAVAKVRDDINGARSRFAARIGTWPSITYPEDLPVSQRRDDVLAAVRDHQVIVLAGETGSGKTTQLPKICLELGRGRRGFIGHTQPRRIAARAVSERVAQEIGSQVGARVGFKVRFNDQVSEQSLIKVMTDGILLAEIQSDRLLTQYDTLIIDEAHERSLNIDFILGYVKQLLPKRPDLKVIITSATIDVDRFSEHFGGAPVIEVSGRTYPVEIRYRPAEQDDDGDIIQSICEAVLELQSEPPGDVLVFLSGEREIRDAADALARLDLRNTDILPLYARLSASEQHRIFTPHEGTRIVLSTNVAETSLTVPGIRYVIDPGTARISRYSMRTKVQRLPIEAISQASANQRAGRCGRVAEGVCVRLYSEEQFLARPEFTEPEVLRTNLGAVILQMAALGLGDLERFPFVEPPDNRAIRDGIALLRELNAVEERKRGELALTSLGRTLAQIPVDPRLGRMLIEADRLGALKEALVVVAALAIQDPRERPMEKAQAADELHRRFRDETSDFLALLNLWNHIREQQKQLSTSAFRRMCKAEFLNYLRVREWQDLHSQLRQIVTQLGLRLNSTPASEQNLHTAVLSGLLSHIGLHDPEKREYLGSRGARFSIFPGSGLFKKPPRWIMAAELVETSRLFARINARIEPEWVEPLAEHLLSRTHSEPHWERKPAAVMALERVTLYGVPLVVGRKVNFGGINPEIARDIFIRQALVEGDWDTHHRFLADNRRLLDEAEDLEHRTRRRDLVVDEETLFEFYDSRVPAEVVSGAHFDRWWKQVRREDPDLLTFTPDMLLTDVGGSIRADDYPDSWVMGDLRLSLTYQFEPGTDADGVTAHVPLPLLNRLAPEPFQWLVPGMRTELITSLIKSLPKNLRVALVPAPDTARELAQRLSPDEGSLTAALELQIQRSQGLQIRHDDWDWAKVPAHLQMTFRITDETGKVVAEGKNLEQLKQSQRTSMLASMAERSQDFELSGMRTWDIEAVPRTFERSHAGLLVRGFPALVDERDSVALRVLDTEEEQMRAMRRGVRKLVLLTTPPAHSALERTLSMNDKLILAHSPYSSTQALISDVVSTSIDHLVAAHGLPWNKSEFEAMRNAIRPDVHSSAASALQTTIRIIAAWHEVTTALETVSSPALATTVQDVRVQIAGLIHDGFIAETGYSRLPHVLRYINAVLVRLKKAPDDPARDRERTTLIEQVRQDITISLERMTAPQRQSPKAQELRWMLEELRVNQFAQALGTPTPISIQRIHKVLDELEA
jgi:ATP-dependent helicase HrpA